MKPFTRNLLLIILLAALLRTAGLDMALFGDETLFAFNVRDQEYVNYYAAHPPLSAWIFTAAGAVFGTSVAVSRAVAAFFSLLTIMLTALIARKAFDERMAIIAAFLLAISPWFLVGSLQLDIVGSFLTFFTILTFFFYQRYLARQKTHDIILTGISIGLAGLTNTAAALLGPLLIIHYWLINRKQRKFNYARFIGIFAPVGIIALAVFAIFPIWSYATSSNTFVDAVMHPLDLMTAQPGEGLVPKEGLDPVLLAIQYLNALLWIGPLLALGTMLFIIRGKKNSLTTLYLLHAAIILLFFTLAIKDNFRPIEKYLLVIAPGLCTLTAAAVKDAFAKKRQLVITGILTAVILAGLFALNLAQDAYLPFYPKQAYIAAALSGAWNVNLPLLGHAGPIGIYVTLSTIMISFLLAGIFGIGTLMRSKKTALYCLLGLAATGTAYGLFLAQELAFSTTGPDISAVTHEMAKHIKEKQYPEPILFFRNTAFEYYLEDAYPIARSEKGMPMFTRQLDFDDENDIERTKQLSGTTIAVVNFPRINTQSPLWSKITQCERTATFTSHNHETGFIARC